jgi:hypothetical protein
MIYQSVTSDIIPGKMAEYDEIASKELLPLLEKYKIKLVGAWHSYTGDMNKVYSLYGFDTLSDYQKFVTARLKDPDFRKMSAKLEALRIRLYFTFLESSTWSPMK